MDPGGRVGVFEIGTLLGAGGMGEVYRARDTRLGRPVAIKFLAQDAQRDPEGLRRFANEARAASALNHPYILTVHEIGEAEGRPFIAMEFVEGQTLRQRLRAGAVEMAEALDLTAQVALALAAAHVKGVVHRDIKPENVMLRPDGFVKVLDFGLAALRTIPSDVALTAGAFDTVAATVGGTIAYMPPEQLEHHHADPRSDIFAVGVLLCELTTGRNPFARSSVIETLNAITQTPAPAEAVTVNLPPVVSRIILKALARRPEDRYQSIRELIVDLERVRAARGDGHVVDLRVRSRRRALIGVAAATLSVLTGVWLYFSAGWNRPPIESIAVLPFVSSSGDPETEYLIQGITTNIVNTLSRLHLPSLRVVPWSAVARYMGKRVDPLDAARTLQVQTVLAGTFTQRGDELDLELELIDVTRVAQLWGDRYRRPLSDIVSLQEQVAYDVANQLRVTLTSDDERRLASHPTENSQAHLLYLKGRNHADKRGPEQLQLARKYFQQAVDLDPNYAQAYAGLAFAETVLNRRGMVAPGEAYARARAAAAKAIQLDEGLPEAHYASAIVKMDFERDWAGAEREFLQAIALNPDSVDARHRYSHLLEALRRPDESFAETQRALAVDPLDPLINAHLGWHYLSVRKFDQAIAACLKARDLGDTYFVHFYLGRVYEEVKRYDEAIAEFKRAHDMFKGDTEAMTAIGHVYAVSGRRREAESVIGQLDALAKQRYVSQGYKALVYAALGDKDRAIATLERAFDEGPEWLLYLNLDSRYDGLRGDARFQGLVKRAGLLRSAPARP